MGDGKRLFVVESANIACGWLALAGSEREYRPGFQVLVQAPAIDLHAASVWTDANDNSRCLAATRHHGSGRIVEQGLRELVISRGRTGYVALYRFDAESDQVFILTLRHHFAISARSARNCSAAWVADRRQSVANRSIHAPSRPFSPQTPRQCWSFKFYFALARLAAATPAISPAHVHATIPPARANSRRESARHRRS